MSETIDPAFIDEYRRMGVEGLNFQGLSVLQQEKRIAKMIAQTGAVTLLDYGCGRGDAYRAPHKLHLRWGVPHPMLYDPARPGIDKKPLGSFHGVICSDVLEHIPEKHVDAVIAELFAYAERFVFASVCCRLAKKCFSDNKTNLHVTVKPFAWWHDKFERAHGATHYCLTETP